MSTSNPYASSEHLLLVLIFLFPVTFGDTLGDFMVEPSKKSKEFFNISGIYKYSNGTCQSITLHKLFNVVNEKYRKQFYNINNQ